MTTQTPATEQRLSRLEGAYEQVDGRLADLRTDVNRLAQGQEALREEMRQGDAALREEMHRGQDALREEIRGLRSEINSRFNTVYAFLATLVAANLGTLVAILLKG